MCQIVYYSQHGESSIYMRRIVYIEISHREIVCMEMERFDHHSISSWWCHLHRSKSPILDYRELEQHIKWIPNVVFPSGLHTIPSTYRNLSFLRWLAPETLRTAMYSQKTDVWSFGNWIDYCNWITVVYPCRNHVLGDSQQWTGTVSRNDGGWGLIFDLWDDSVIL